MTKKFVAVLNESFEVARQLNALGHITAGLAGEVGGHEALGLVTYEDAEGNRYPNISQFPFIILKANGNKLKIFRQALIENKLPHSCFLDTMFFGGSDVQIANTKEKKSDELTIVGIVTFAEREILDPLTKKFSLYK